ncbi:MAG: hypothetical protein WD042_11165 [Phycisphaeraceae bacterium]
MLTLLAQATADTAAQAQPSAWAFGFDNLFWVAILFIFLTAIISAVIRLRQKDKCLKLMHDYHVSYLNVNGRASWGDLRVYSQGVELLFDAPYTTRRGLLKSGVMVYQAELAQCQALCRIVAGLTDQEKRDRKRQIRQTFNPGLLRKTWRSIRNLFNTIKDAFNKAFSAFVGQFAKVNPASRVLTSQQGHVTEIGTTLLSAVGNAYEPMLEQHIGQPVILELASPADPEKKVVEFSGYLVDYTDKFVAVFNVDHEPIETIELELTDSHEQAGFKVTMAEKDVTITCNGFAALVVQQIRCGRQVSDLALVLTNGASVQLSREPGMPVRLKMERTRRLDIVCPRSQAAVRFASRQIAPERRRRNWLGLAPLLEEREDRS